MRINSNIPALNANRILGKNTRDLGDTLERLSSGKRINRASDDAAGLAISQKMKAQIRGLQQASRNSLDGVSMIQTGEGALDEVHQMIQRMRELSVQGANGVYGTDDLEAILEEMNQLTDQIQKVAEQTDFNGVKILNGYKEEMDLEKLDIDPNNIYDKMKNLEKEIETKNEELRELEKKLALGSATAAEVATKKTEIASKKADLETEKTNYEAKKVAAKAEQDIIDAKTKEIKDKNKEIEKKQKEIDDKSKAIEEKYREIEVQEELLKTASDANKPAIQAKIAALNTEKNNLAGENQTLIGERTALETAKSTLETARDKARNDQKDIKKEAGINIEEQEKRLASMYLQVGANEGDHLFIDLESIKIDINKLGKEYDSDGNIKTEVGPDGKPVEKGTSIKAQVDKLRDLVEVGSEKPENRKIEDAFSMAISTYDNAVKRVSSVRAKMGAIQNRLDSTIRTLDNSVENLTGAMSRIEDIDMAGEMSEFTKLQVLQQSSTAMLAEANKLPQTVLQLLQG